MDPIGDCWERLPPVPSSLAFRNAGKKVAEDGTDGKYCHRTSESSITPPRPTTESTVSISDQVFSV